MVLSLLPNGVSCGICYTHRVTQKGRVRKDAHTHTHTDPDGKSAAWNWIKRRSFSKHNRLFNNYHTLSSGQRWMTVISKPLKTAQCEWKWDRKLQRKKIYMYNFKVKSYCQIHLWYAAVAFVTGWYMWASVHQGIAEAKEHWWEPNVQINK